jgi:iduronate 2-sulfatase
MTMKNKRLKCFQQSLKNSVIFLFVSSPKFYSRFTILLALGCLFLQKAIAQDSLQSPNYNVLFIAVDDLKPNLGCYGDQIVQSPNIDRLAESGTVFLNNHCQQAVCAPSRASLLTGWRPDRTMVWNLSTLIRDKNPDIVTLPQYYKANGYETAGTGKIFDPRSVDSQLDALSWSVPFANVGGGRWIEATEKISTESGEVDDSELTDGKIALKGIELMQQLSTGDKPFFLAVGFKKPHLPFVAPQRYWDLYNRDDFSIHPFQLHAKNAPEFAFQPGWELRDYVDIPDDDPISEAKQKELIHGYYACISFIDTQVGMLLAQLDSLGIRDSTVVMLWGDHGWHLGDHDMWAKHSTFEQATRSPLIIAAPGFSGGTRSNSPTEFVDIFPTLCQLTNIEVPSDIDGVSLVPVLENPETMVKQYAISQYKRNANGQKVEGYALRTKRYRYVEWLAEYHSFDPYDESKVVARELYDYEVDSLETISVVDSLEYQSTVDELSGMLQEFLSKQVTSIKDIQGNITFPKTLDVQQNYPNPFNPETSIQYILEKKARVELAIYSVLGQKIITLVNSNRSAGTHTAVWNGLNQNGQTIPSGVYFYTLESDSKRITKKMIMVK